MPGWGWVLVGVGVAQILAVVGAVWVFCRAIRRGRPVTADVPTVEIPAVPAVGPPKPQGEALDRYLAERSGGPCRCMTCHAFSGAEITQDGSHDRYPFLSDQMRDVYRSHCESILEAG